MIMDFQFFQLYGVQFDFGVAQIVAKHKGVIHCTVQVCYTRLVFGQFVKAHGGLKNYVLNCLWSCTASKNSMHRPMTIRNCDISSWRLSRWTGNTQ